MRQIEVRNVVLRAPGINASLLAERWLIRHGVVQEDEFEDDNLFTPMVVQVQAGEFRLMAMPEMIQFALKTGAAAPGELVKDRVGRLVDALPDIPYSAIGVNFHWKAEAVEGVDFGEALRTMFVPPESQLHGFFDGEDCRFGGYMSKDVLGARLKLDVKPVNEEVEGRVIEGLVYQFNFHTDLSEGEAVQEIHAALDTWEEADELSREILMSTTEWCEG